MIHSKKPWLKIHFSWWVIDTSRSESSSINYFGGIIIEDLHTIFLMEDFKEKSDDQELC